MSGLDPLQPSHSHAHAFGDLRAREREGLVIASRRSMLKASLAGLAGLSMPDLLRLRASADATKPPGGKSVILLWMAGGPSQIDTWDPKPNRPLENRGPFGVIPTRLPGVFVCEHLPKQAAMLDKFTIIRSVDPRHSNHEPNKVFQTANLDAEPRVSPSKDLYPAIGSIVAKHHGANQPGIPPYIAFQTSRTHIAHAGYLGKQFDPFIANQACKLPVYDNVGKDLGRTSPAGFFKLPGGMTHERLMNRQTLLDDLDALRRTLDHSPDVAAMDRYGREAVDLLVGRRAQEAFDLEQEPESVRDRYGKHLWCQQALLARRLVEAGAAFITLDLSYHTASGTWDNHGDNIPPYGGISKGLQPLLPLFDHLITTLVSDLDERGLLDDVMVIAMGEFGRTPRMGTQGSTDGRDHWSNVMSMCLAGGGLKHGQVIGSTEADGGHIKDHPVTPSDLAATIYRHMGVPLDAFYYDANQRPHFIVGETGRPIPELF
ncbi:DUF1501 domain-containing protein [Planctomyces sp. SH-PL62]|uniref:DUF1501 domain-containing protein n=1 Tax=Planctomyces sp. SH-PL62 TaxID=1636152 RepID=UPI00078D72FC|nr:DUF1501 domain-containing protein [Planctomyces sp. SH-PL62]AMV37639.1 hypothetical protein VT85_09395 [Planctomyces sp. SH-PL62]